MRTDLKTELQKETTIIRREITDIVPTEEEKKNGWTTKTLTKYLASAAASQSLHIDPHSLKRKVLPNEQNHKYKVLRWRE